MDAEKEYELFAVVVHMGSGPNHGHYVCLVKTHKHWILFDDDEVQLVDDDYIQSVFGAQHDVQASTDTGYLLFYC